MKTRKIVGILAALAGIYAFKECVNSTASKNYLSRDDFNKMQWCQVDNPDGILWDNYMRTQIPKNQVNWDLYVNTVKERNPSNKGLIGKLSVPCEIQSKK